MFYICTVIKNEHTYLKEWIEYHLSLGVDKICLFEDGDNTHADIVKDYDKVELKKAENGDKSHLQLQRDVYNNFLQNTMKIGDWCAFIDADEFLMGMDVPTIKSTFNDLQEISVIWKIFNANRHEKSVKSRLTEFTEPIKNWSSYLSHDSKSIIHKLSDNLRFKSGIHHLYLPETNIVKQKAQWGNKLWINHYYTGSLEDWKRRLERGAFKERFKTLALFYKYNPDMKK